MATLQWLSVLWVSVLLTGCASIFGGRSASSETHGTAPAIQFSAQVFTSEIRSGDQEIRFADGYLTLNRRELSLSSPGNPSAQTAGQRILSLSRMRSASLYPGDVTHPNQIQLGYEKELVLIQVLGTNRTNDDRRTQQLYELLITNGVARGRTDQFYYVGMDLSEQKAGSESGNPFSAAASARAGEFIWDSIKGFGKLLIKPFVPLF